MKNMVRIWGSLICLSDRSFKLLLFLSFVLKFLVSDYMPYERQKDLRVPNGIFMDFFHMFSTPSHALEGHANESQIGRMLAISSVVWNNQHASNMSVVLIWYIVSCTLKRLLSHALI